MIFDNKQAKAEALGNYRLLDVHRWSDFPEVDNAVDAIYVDLCNDPDFGGNKTLRKKHIKVVVLDLYAAWLADPDRYIAYHRTNNQYDSKSRYNILKISYLTVSVVDALKDYGYVEHHIGYQDRSELGKSHLSRMKVTDKLIDLIKDEHQVPAHAIQRYKGVETVILRDRDSQGRKIAVEYGDNANTNRMRKALTAYNALLDKTVITLPEAPEDGIPTSSGNRNIKIDHHDKFVRRIFNNGSFDEGGRFYGGWWQRIPGDWRVKISMDGAKEGSVEVDYSGLHIVLLYALQGLDYWKEEDAREDPYIIDGVEQSPQMRSLLKLILLVIINAKDRDTALGAIRKEINDNPDEYGWTKTKNTSIEQLMDAFIDRHSPIKDYFHSGFGTRLQKIDSIMAGKVIETFTSNDIPVLSVHDSFVIHPKHSNELIRVMDSVIYGLNTIFPDIKIKITPKMKHNCLYDVKCPSGKLMNHYKVL